MKVNVLVECQYFENYNVGPDGFNTFGVKFLIGNRKVGIRF